jgi:hypothetical protein
MIQFQDQIQLQKISEDAWIVNDNAKHVGILHRTIQDKYTYLDKTETILFDNSQDVKEFFKNKFVFEEEVSIDITQPSTFYIKGHAVDYPTPVPVDSSDPDYLQDIPLFAKTETSDVYYAAGWYCIHFGKGWKSGNCPKLSTLLQYGYEGPFKTKLEVKQRLKALNKAKRIEEKNEAE